MTTVYMRFRHFDLPHDKVILAKAGEIVSTQFKQKNLYGRILFEQVEPHGTFKVWAYPNEYENEIDKVIYNLLRPKRKRITNQKVNG